MDNVVRRLRIWLAMILGIIVFSCCIRENRSDCLPEPETRFIVLKVIDVPSGRDITASGEAGDAGVFFFASDGSYSGFVSVSSREIVQRVPIPVSGRNLGGYYVSAWSNAEGGQKFHTGQDGGRIEGMAVSLIGGEEGYRNVPDDLFFGYARLAPAGGPEPEEVTIVRKNARMHITVRGLDVNLPEERYYLTVENPSSGYDFAGNPAGDASVVKVSGSFDASGDYSSDETFCMIHSDTSLSSAGNIRVNLYDRGFVRNADRLVVSATNDDRGREISLPSGKTVNLLIDLRSGTGSAVRMEITPWDEIYQWEMW